jgi:radical SAM superfamily enzyme YgiQ (UPF0313 family)
MKVLLTHGYFIHEDIAESAIMKPYPPLGILYLSAGLNKAGIPNTIFDSTFSDRESLERFIDETKPDIIGIYSTLMTRWNILGIIAFVKMSFYRREITIIIGGPDARYHANDYLDFGADIIVPGEGDEVLPEIIDVFSSRWMKKLADVRGIYVRGTWGGDMKNRFVFTGERKPMDIRDVPIPDYSEIDVPSYLEHWKSKHGYFSMTINSMRGCPYSCNWCCKSVFGNTYRRRDAVAVVDEMELLINKFHPDQVWFTDDVFTISKEWLKEFNSEIQKRNVVLPYECVTRSDCLDDEVAELLKISGCSKVWIGAESGSQHVIDLMNRRIDLVWTSRMINSIKSHGMLVGTFIMLGYHGEKKKDILKTARFLKRTLPDEFTVGTAYPIKGTKYFETVEPFFYHRYNWESGSERQIKFKKPFNDRFYRFASRYLINIIALKKAGPGERRRSFFFKAMVSKMYILLFR